MIVTLWTVTLVTILVAGLASQTRLSAQLAWRHQQDLQDWADLVAALNQAEMELLMELMPEAPQRVDDLSELNVAQRYRFDGRDLALHYPQPAGIQVRIYDHSGKINLRELSLPRLRSLLVKRLGQDANTQIDAMLAAWQDWHDLNDMPSPNGAEKDYYLSLATPYEPRNGRLESVEEILSIRGFDEVFEDVDLDAAFTLHGENELVNLNVATVEAMRLLPGLEEETIQAILAWRQDNEFRGNGDVVRLVPAERMGELRPWLNNRKPTNHYTIMVYKDHEYPDNQQGRSSTAWAQVVEVRDTNERPRVLKVNPYQPLPLRFELTAVE
jgi:general secretion pathway protein K